MYQLNPQTHDLALFCAHPGNPLAPLRPPLVPPLHGVLPGECATQGQWGERVRLAHEALLLLKELMVANSEELRECHAFFCLFEVDRASFDRGLTRGPTPCICWQSWGTRA